MDYEQDDAMNRHNWKAMESLHGITMRSMQAMVGVLTRDVFNRRDGVVVRAFASQSVDLGFIP